MGLSLLAVAPALAQQDAGISVVGAGEARGKPNQLEFRARLAGSGELGADAVVKFQEFKRRSLAAVEGLGLEGLQIEVGGFSVTQGGDPNQAYQQMMIFNAGGQDESPKIEVAVSSAFKISLGGIQDLDEEKVLETATNLLDKLSDAGVVVIPNQQAPAYDDTDVYAMPALATFVLEDASELREQAREAAFKNARASAERLAELAGVKLGTVLSVQEVSNNTATTYSYTPYGVAIPSSAGAADGKVRLVSRTFGEIPVQVSLQVRFAVKE